MKRLLLWKDRKSKFTKFRDTENGRKSPLYQTLFFDVVAPLSKTQNRYIGHVSEPS